MIISEIVAISANRAIGKDNQLLWHIGEDLQNFKRITLGHSVIVGRKTFESLGRKLPNRTNIIISRNSSYSAPEGCVVVGSLEEAVEYCRLNGEQEVFIIGGGQIYQQALPLCQRLYVTEVEREYEGDTFYPSIDPLVWRRTSHERLERGANFDYPFSYNIYERI